VSCQARMRLQSRTRRTGRPPSRRMARQARHQGVPEQCSGHVSEQLVCRDCHRTTQDECTRWSSMRWRLSRIRSSYRYTGCRRKSKNVVPVNTRPERERGNIEHDRAEQCAVLRNPQVPTPGCVPTRAHVRCRLSFLPEEGLVLEHDHAATSRGLPYDGRPVIDQASMGPLCKRTVRDLHEGMVVSHLPRRACSAHRRADARTSRGIRRRWQLLRPRVLVVT
jgi:hypothetical protein